MTILIIFVYAFNWNKTAKLYLPSTFQTSDIELQGLCDRSPRIAKSPRKSLANPSYANLGVIEALASTDARRGTC